MTRRRLAFALILTAAAGLSVYWQRPSQGADPPAEVVTTPRAESPPIRWKGAGSCSASACHGDAKPDLASNILGNEYTVWVERDPHSRAFTLLYDEPARRMATRLDLPAPHKAAECLACHSPEQPSGPHQAGVTRTDGVSCEACHGPAEKWLAAHTERGWGAQSPQYKLARGMRDTDDLAARAQLCSECHVGSPGRAGAPDRDVNHDMIAAGHPPLKFEFATFLDKMPKHWIEPALVLDHPGHDPAFHARAWLVGQAASAEAALNLLADRAGDSQKPWPEFAEYDCFACHHDLQYPAWRQKQPASVDEQDRPIGLPRWGSWYYPLLPFVAQADGDRALDPLPNWPELAGAMATMSRDRKRAAQVSSTAAKSLGAWGAQLSHSQYDRRRIREMLVQLANDEPATAATNWDGAAQVYLGLVALRLASLAPARGQEDQELLDALREFRSELTFPSATRQGQPRVFASPRDFDATRENRALDRIRELLEQE